MGCLRRLLDTALPKAGRLFPHLSCGQGCEAVCQPAQTPSRAQGTVFHSTRKWFITQCERTGVPEHFTATLVGITQQGQPIS